MTTIATLSDLHTDFADNRDVLVQLCVAIHDRGADAVVVAGDISHKDDRIRRTLEALKVAAPIVAYLPGNHDLWFDVPFAAARPELDSWHRYREHLAGLAASVGAHYLPSGPLHLPGAAVVGSCGWYDYSFLLPEIGATVDAAALESKTMDGAMWSDARFVAFRDAAGGLMPDPAVSARMIEDMRGQLATAAAASGVERIVAVTHHLPFDEVVLRTGSLPWEFFNAFMGATGMGQAILAEPKVETVVYGHTHITGDTTIDGRRVYGTPLGYPRERPGLSMAQVIETRIGWIELPEPAHTDG